MATTRAAAPLYIGTSGWHYKHWRTAFYPSTSTTRDWLPHYAGYFNTVELNNVFYRFPSEKAVEQWRELVPEKFLFSVKAGGFLTHRKKLTDPQQPIQNLLDRMGHLRDKLGPILFNCRPGGASISIDWQPSQNGYPGMEWILSSNSVFPPGMPTRC